MTTIYFIRHSKFDRRMVKTKNETLPLTKEGINYARHMFNNKELMNIDVLYSSEFLRTKQTAKIISDYNNNIKINVSGLINERAKGNTHDVPSSFWDTQLIDENAKTIGGESRKEVSNRMLSFVNMVLDKYQGKKIVAVSHAVAITYLLMNYCELISFDHHKKYRCLKYKDEYLVDGLIEFCDIFKFTFDENKKLINIERIHEKN